MGGIATNSGVRCLCDGEQLAGEWEAEAGRGEFDLPFVGPANAAGDFRFPCFHWAGNMAEEEALHAGGAGGFA
jgi:hypothetical protein